MESWKLGKKIIENKFKKNNLKSECSTNCGFGEQKRSLSCIQRDSFGKIEEKAIEECILATNSEKPIIIKNCSNLGN